MMFTFSLLQLLGDGLVFIGCGPPFFFFSELQAWSFSPSLFHLFPTCAGCVTPQGKSFFFFSCGAVRSSLLGFPLVRDSWFFSPPSHLEMVIIFSLLPQQGPIVLLSFPVSRPSAIFFSLSHSLKVSLLFLLLLRITLYWIRVNQ